MPSTSAQLRLGPLAGQQPVGHTTYPTLRGPSYGIRTYVYLSGTSMATGVVNGSAALLIEAARTTFGAAPTPNTLKAMLMRTAFPMSDATGQPYHVLAQGAGAVNPAGALALAQAINPTLPVNSTWLVSNPLHDSPNLALDHAGSGTLD